MEVENQGMGQIPENQGMGQIWDDKQQNLWYNSNIKKGEKRKPVGLQRVFAFLLII